VRDLCDRADVGRSTYYAHFESKEDLLFAGFDEWLVALVDTPAPGEELGTGGARTDGHFRFSLPLLEHIRTQRRFFRATIVGGLESRIRRKTTGLLADLARREIAREAGEAGEAGGEGGAPTGRETLALTGEAAAPGRRVAGVGSRAEEEARLEARAHAVAGAFLAITTWWMENPRRLSAEAVDRVLQESVRAPGT